MRMAQQNFRKRFKLIRRIGRSCRVTRAVQHQPLSLSSDGFFQLLWCNLKVHPNCGIDDHRCAAVQQCQIRIRHPIWRRYDYLIAFVHGCCEGVVNNLLTAGAHCNLVDVIIEPVLALEFVANCLTQFRNAGRRGIAGLTVAHRLNRCFLDVARRVEIRLAYGKPDDVFTLRFHFL